MDYGHLGEGLALLYKALCITFWTMLPFTLIGLWVSACWLIEFFAKHWH